MPCETEADDDDDGHAMLVNTVSNPAEMEGDVSRRHYTKANPQG